MTTSDKMSEIISEFARPLLEQNPDRYRKIIPIAITVWNLTLLPKKEQKEAREELLAAYSEHDPELKEIWVSVVEFFSKRKERHFAEDERIILDYTILDKEDSYNLTIVSSNPKESQG